MTNREIENKYSLDKHMTSTQLELSIWLFVFSLIELVAVILSLRHMCCDGGTFYWIMFICSMAMVVLSVVQIINTTIHFILTKINKKEGKK